MRKITLFIVLVITTSCAEMNSINASQASSNKNEPTFSTEKIMKVHSGMSVKEILTLFGEPKSISQSMCGASTGHPWNCVNWEYGSYPNDRATFTFDATNPDNVILNNFKIDRK